MRDYAVQHMPPIFGQVSPDDQARLQETMWQATTETGSSIAGTALLALLDLSQSGSSLDQGRIVQIALNVANNNQGGELSRITAVEVCGRMQVEQALPVVEQLAQTAQSMPLRIAATAALGDLGDPSATETLTNLANSSDRRQAFAAQSALNRLVKRAGY